MRRLALLVVRRRWVVIFAAVLFLPIAGVVGGGVAGRLTADAMEVRGSESARAAAALSKGFTTVTPEVRTAATGRAEVARQASEQAEHDLHRGWLLTAVLAFVVLIVVFGGVVAALLPLVVGVPTMAGALLILTLLASLTDVPLLALNVTSALGIGLAIDYSLLVVSRYREELATGASTNVAVGRALQTAGRTVVFSAGAVIVSLAALLLFPVTYVGAFAGAGVAVVFLAAVAAVVVLPAVLAALGPRVESLRVLRRRAPSVDGAWSRQAARVMRHPVRYAVGVTAVLVLLAIPFLRFTPGLGDQSPAHLPTREPDALQVLAPNVHLARDPAAVRTFATRLATLPGVGRVDAGTGSYRRSSGRIVVTPVDGRGARFRPDRGTVGTWLSVVPRVAPDSTAGQQLVRAIRASPAPFAFSVAGASATLVDTKASVRAVLPWALALIAAATFVLLFLMTGSLLVPVKAIPLSVLGLTATFGALVWIFQDGHLSGLLGFTATGSVDVFTPVLVFGIAFGLSVGYQVVLLARIKEEHDLDRDDERAIRVGLQKTGRSATAAALLLTVVFAGLATSAVSRVQAFGVGLALAVLVDAFVVRPTLVPAFLRLTRRGSWWAPARLRRWHLRYGIPPREPIAILDRELEASR